MKKALIITLLLFSWIHVYPVTFPFQNEVQVGDVLVLGKASAQTYQHIHFPKTRFIMKKGGIANYKRLAGTQVIVTAVEKDESGTTLTIKRKDGKKFFGVISSTKVHLEKGVESKEIIQKP